MFFGGSQDNPTSQKAFRLYLDTNTWEVAEAAPGPLKIYGFERIFQEHLGGTRHRLTVRGYSEGNGFISVQKRES